MRFISFFVTLFLLSINCFSQTEGIELFEKVMNELPKTELHKLEPTTELFEKAENLMQEADKMLQNIDRINVKYPHVSEKEQKKYTKQIKKLRYKASENILLASKTYTEADTLLYSVFKKNIKEVRNNKNTERNLLCIRLEKEADEIHNTYTALSRILFTTKKDESELSKFIYEIKNLEIQSINRLAHIYGLYLRWSDVLNLHKKNLESVEESNFILSNEYINTDSTTIDKYAFSIQLHTQKESLSEKELHELKRKFIKTQTVVDGVWIIYSVGEYWDYFEASKHKPNTECYISAFKNGVQVEIGKAILESMKTDK